MQKSYPKLIIHHLNQIITDLSKKIKKNETEKLSRICKYFQETMHYLSQITTQTVQLNSRRNEKEKILKSCPELISKNFQERW